MQHVMDERMAGLTWDAIKGNKREGAEGALGDEEEIVGAGGEEEEDGEDEDDDNDDDDDIQTAANGTITLDNETTLNAGSSQQFNTSAATMLLITILTILMIY